MRSTHKNHHTALRGFQAIRFSQCVTSVPSLYGPYPKMHFGFVHPVVIVAVIAKYKKKEKMFYCNIEIQNDPQPIL